jgi:hypothetical protein
MENVKLTTEEKRINKLIELQRKIEREKENSILEYVKSFGTLEEKEFFQGIELLKKLSLKYKENFNKAIEEFARLLACEEAFDETLTLPFEKFIKFYNTYEDLKTVVSESIYDDLEGYSDDGCSDYIDAFLLNGFEMYQEAVRGNMSGYKYEQWKKYEKGELYIEGTIREALIQYMPSYLHRKERTLYMPPKEKKLPDFIVDWGKE